MPAVTLYRRALCLTLFSLCFSFCLLLTPASAQDKEQEFEMKELTISAIIERYAKLEGKVIVPNDRLFEEVSKKKARIIVPKGLEDSPQHHEMWKHIMDSVLKIYQYALIEKGSGRAGFTRLVRVKDAAKIPTPIFKSMEGRDLKSTSEKIVTQVCVLKHIENNASVSRLFAWVSNVGPPIPMLDKKTFIITAYESDIKYFLELLSIIDVPAPKDPSILKIYELKRASVTEVQRHISSYYNIIKARRKLKNNADIPYVLPDIRTNRLMVSAKEDYHKVVKEMIDFFDQEGISNTVRGIWVYRLKNSNAEELAKKLDQVLKGRRKKATVKGKKAAEPPSIVPFEALNALIISADTIEAYESIVQVVKLLDIKRKQVHISVTILEVSETKDFSLGTELGGLVDPEKGKFGLLAGSGFGLSETAISLIDPTAPSITRTPLPPAGGISLALPYSQYNLVPFILRATEGKVHSNVLARPSILCDDNEKAQISITEGRSVVTNTVNTGGTTTSGFGGVQEAGINLSIAPTISSGNFLKLEINLKVDRFISDSSDNRDARSNRSADTVMTIPNLHTVVIGGMTQKQRDKNTSSVPLLGRVPILGHLFRSKSNNYSETTLYFFITPEIITEFDQMAAMSNRIHKKTKSLEGNEFKDEYDFTSLENNLTSRKEGKTVVSESAKMDVLSRFTKMFSPVLLRLWVKADSYDSLASALAKMNRGEPEDILPKMTEVYFDKTELNDTFFKNLSFFRNEMVTWRKQDRTQVIRAFNEHLIKGLKALQAQPKSNRRSLQDN